MANTPPPELDLEATEDVEPAELNWAAEVIGKNIYGHAVKIQVTFTEEPDHDREQKMRAEAQSVMRRQHGEWVRGGPGAMTYRKWPLK